MNEKQVFFISKIHLFYVSMIFNILNLISTYKLNKIINYHNK